MQCYLVIFFFFFFFITAPEYHITIVYIGKAGVKIEEKNICNGTKIVLKLYFEKLYIMIVTDMCAFVHAWVIALEYEFVYEKKRKMFNKFQFIDQIAIKKKGKAALVYKSLRSVNQFP